VQEEGEVPDTVEAVTAAGSEKRGACFILRRRRRRRRRSLWRLVFIGTCSVTSELVSAFTKE
jgi:hypothetical protein